MGWDGRAQRMQIRVSDAQERVYPAAKADDGMLDWDDLRFFLAVARHRTLAAAAKQLHVTQSTVSRRIASLQDGMGVRLLHRTADGYVPTLAGESVLTHVERVEAETLLVERAVAGQDIRLEGQVRVASSQLLTSHLLAPSFAALHRLHRDIQIEAHPETPGALEGRSADIVLRLRPFADGDLVVRRLGRVSFGLYACLAYLARHGQPETSDGLAGHQLITLLDEPDVSDQAAWLADHAGRAVVTLKADSYETQHWAVYCSGGLALLPRFRADAEPALRRIPTATPVPSADIWLGVHRENRAIPRVRIVLDLIAETVRSRLHELDPGD